MPQSAAAPGRQPTLADVAALAGVSDMTVSNVINRPHVVAPATQARVRAAMKELNYRNNIAARSLRLATPRHIAYAMTHSYRASDQYMSEFLHDLAVACQPVSRNLTLVAGPTDRSDLDQCEDLYFGGSASGVIISNVDPDDPRPRELMRRGIPFVAYGQTLEGADVPWSWVDGDAALGAALAVDHVVAQGHRRLALLRPSDEGVVALDAMESGYRAACIRHGLAASVGVERVVRTANEPGAGSEAAERLLVGADPPTAIICLSDTLATGVVMALRDLGLDPGTEVAVTGFSDTPQASLGPVGITSIRQPSPEIAAELVKIVVENPDVPRHVLLEPTLVIRASSARVPDGSR